MLDESDGLTLATTVSLPVVRGPVQLAKALAALDLLSGGRVVAGVGPGSSERDSPRSASPPTSAGAVSTRRSRRSARCSRATRGSTASSTARGVRLEPRPAQRSGPPIWVASWGSPPGLRRVARLGDGWLASAYNTTPERFGACLGRLDESFPNALATAWMYVTEDAAEAERMLADVLAPMVNRPLEELRELSLPIGPAEVCAERLADFARAGVQRLFVWPLRDEVAQLERFSERVVPLVG